MKLQVSMNALLKIKTAFDVFSPVSLLANLSGDIGEVDQAQLREQKIYDDNGLTDEAKTLFGRLNQAIKAERTHLLTPIGQIQRVVYHFDQGPVISVNQNDGIYVIEDPGEVEKSLALYSDIFGTSDTMIAEIYYDLKELEALVLAGIMDLRIELGLSVLLGIEPKEGLTKEKLLAYFSKPQMNSRLAPLVYGLMEEDTYNLTSEQLTVLLDELVTKGCIELDGDEIAVADALVVMADSLLVFNSVVKADNYLVGEDKLFGEKSLVIYGSPTAILMISKGSSGIGFVSISGHDLMEVLL